MNFYITFDNNVHKITLDKNDKVYSGLYSLKGLIHLFDPELDLCVSSNGIILKFIYNKRLCVFSMYQKDIILEYFYNDNDNGIKRDSQLFGTIDLQTEEQSIACFIQIGIDMLSCLNQILKRTSCKDYYGCTYYNEKDIVLKYAVWYRYATFQNSESFENKSKNRILSYNKFITFYTCKNIINSKFGIKDEFNLIEFKN